MYIYIYIYIYCRGRDTSACESDSARASLGSAEGFTTSYDSAMVHRLPIFVHIVRLLYNSSYDIRTTFVRALRSRSSAEAPACRGSSRCAPRSSAARTSPRP